MMSCKKLILSFAAVVCTCRVFWWGIHNVSRTSLRESLANSSETSSYYHHHTPTFGSTQNVLTQTLQKPVTPSDQRAPHHLNPPQLSEADIAGVEKFVFFIGYPRSGHSIIGTMMDAHPNMIIAHEYLLFSQWDTAERNKLKNKTYLFHRLYENSVNATKGLGWRSVKNMNKGYSLAMNSTWEGRFDKLKIIGDKSGGRTSQRWNRHASKIKVYYQELLDTVKIPVHVLHVVRNPYDMIATAVVYAAPGHPRYPSKGDKKYFNPTLLMDKANYILEMADAVDGMVKELDLNLLQLHSRDFIKDPKGTMRRICVVLEVECPEDYLQECYDKTYKVVSKSRNLVVWTPEVREIVDKAIEKHTFFHTYSFQSD